MDQKPQTIAERLKAMKIVNLALIGGVGSFCAVAFFITESGGMGDGFGISNFNLLTGLVGFAGLAFFLGNKVFNKRVDEAMGLGSLDEKLEVYQKASIIRYALIEAPAFVGIILFMLVGYELFYVVPLMAMATMFWLRPSPERIAEEMHLSSEESRQLQQP